MPELDDNENGKHYETIPSDEWSEDDFDEWFNDTAETLHSIWNKNHPDPSDEKHISLDEIKERMQKGIDDGKSPEEIENY